MIDAISFSILDKETIYSKTKSYNPLLLSNKHLTHIDGLPVMPLDCYPNIFRPDGEYKDNLNTLYKKYYNVIKKEPENNTLIEKSKHDILIEIQNRWKSGKHGRWRQDICGKRCNFSARSVLSPNPNLTLTQVGIPIGWEKNLTLMDKYDINMDTVAVLDSNGRSFDTRFKKPSIGDTVLRKLKNTELVLVNRQPTLRDSNLVAMEVLWTKEKTVQLHPGLFSMFDADCDGDEINIHLPQTTQSHLQKLHIKKSLVDFGNSTLTPSVIQDAVVGLCIRGSHLKKRDIHNEVYALKNDSGSMLNKIHVAYKDGCESAYEYGFSVGFDFKEVDLMIATGAKGKTIHKQKIRLMLDGAYNDELHFKDCQSTRLAVISTSLKTAETGYISRRLAYHLDDVKIDNNNLCVDCGKMILQFPNHLPEKVMSIKNIGLHLVSVFMPPLTQKMLDSFHAAAVGESIDNQISQFQSLINCTSPELHHIYVTYGIIYLRIWLLEKLNTFFGKSIHEYWITLFVDFLCISGKPIGVGMTRLNTRIQQYHIFEQSLVDCDDEVIHTFIPILKYCKFGSPYKTILNAAKLELRDNLESQHSREFFF
tara:strand:+ start:790 stop:2565 length:1776 start_codon:yes stop_codon:yes gene_type:complete